MNHRKIAMIAGVLFVLTFVFSIPARFLYAPILDDANFILGSGSIGQVRLGALLEVLLIVANVGTALALYPVLKKQFETGAISYVAARLMESAAIAVGVVSVISIITMREDLAGASGAGAAQLVTEGQSLVALLEGSFLLGPGIIVGFGNGMLLGYMMYRTGLVPRRMAMLGLVGGPLLLVSGALVLFGVHEQVSASAFLLALPEILWEASFGIYLIVKGFKPAAIKAEEPTRVEMEPAPAPA